MSLGLQMVLGLEKEVERR